MANIYHEQQLSKAYNETNVSKYGMAKDIAESAEQLGKSSAELGYHLYQRFGEGKEGSEIKTIDEATKGEELGRKNFQDCLEIAGNQAMTELANNPAYSSNPTALASEIDKVRDKMISSVGNDEETQINIARNFELKKNALVNSAQVNFYKQQREQAEANIYGTVDSLDPIIQSYGYNIGNGYIREDMIGGFKYAQDQAIRNINKVDAYGNYVLTPTQRRSLIKQVRENSGKAFESAYETMDDSNKKIFYDAIMNDTPLRVVNEKGDGFVKIKGVDGKEQEMTVKPSKIVGEENYFDLKRSIINARSKELAFKEKATKVAQMEAVAEFQLNPSKAGLEEIKKTYTGIKQEELDRLESLYNESPNYMAETQAEAMAMVENKISSVASEENKRPDGSPDYDKQLKTLIDINELITKQTIGVDAQLGYEDAQMLREKAAKALIDEEERKIRMELKKDNEELLNNISLSVRMGGDLEGEAMAAGYTLQKQKETINVPFARMIAKQTIQLAERELSNLANTPEERVKRAKEIYKAGKEMQIRIRNPEIGDKKVGDKYTVNGVTYEIVSFDNYDVQVRVLK